MSELIRLLLAIIDIYMLVLIARCVFSWLPPQAQANKFYEFLYAITEPLMRPFRRVIPPMGGLDLSPILLFLVLIGLKSVLRRLLW